MGSYAEYKERKTTNAQATDAPNHQEKSAYQQYKERKKPTNSGYSVDTDYQSLMTDYKSFVAAAQADSANVGYGNARGYLEGRSATAKDLRDRANKLALYLHSNQDALDAKVYENAISDIETVEKEIGNIMDYFGDNARYFSQWATEDDYNAYIANNAAVKQVLSGYDKTAHAAEAQAGWEDYNATQKQIAEDKQKAEEDKSWFDKLGEYLGGAQDTSLPVHLTGEITKGVQEQDKKLNYPTDDWTEDQKLTFGYLWKTNRQKAWQYGRMVNTERNRQAEQAKLQQIQDAATKNFGSGVAHTVGSILSAPLGLADTLGDVIEMGALGRLSEADGEITPNEYAEAVKGGISQSLNEKGGTLSKDIPIIGGKGWGDVYGLGTSVAQSMLAAHTGGAGQAIITSFGPAVQSGINSAKSRGATDEQAMSFGLMSGLAEALAEQIGVDNLLKIGSASTLKELSLNILKQGAAEGLEEGITSLATNFADQLVMKDKSEYNLAAITYMSNGMSKEEAEKQAWLDMAEGILFDMLAGFTSGGISGGLETGVKSALAALNKSDTATPAAPENAPSVNPSPEQQPQSVQQYVDELLNSISPATENTAQSKAPTNKRSQAGITQLFDAAIIEAQKASGASVGTSPATSAPDVEKTEGRKRSKVYTNTYENATGEAVQSIGQAAQQLDPGIADYVPITEKESFTNAVKRLSTQDDIDQQYQQLVSKEGWTGEDNDTAMLVMDHLRRSGDVVRFRDMARTQRAQATQGGQLVQSFAKYTRTPTSAAAAAMETLDSFAPSDVPRKFWRGKSFNAWKGEIAASVLDISNQIEAAADGNAAGMRDVVRALANFRRTTAWFGTSNNLTKAAERALSKLDYEKAKDIAIAQLSQIPGDFKKRSAGEIVKTIRIYNLLSSISTVNRNIVGNASVGIVDAVSDSTVGRALDALVSYWTGKRTVGNDVTHAKTYFNAAVEAAEMASLCAELDIPMDSESRYSTGPTRTFSPQGGPVARFFSAYEKGMKYALEVTDKFFEGGTRSAVDESLRALGAKANLSEDQIQSLSHKAGQRRTFKDDRKLAKAAKGTKKALNELGTESVGVGDLSMPFAGTGSNVTQTAIDYTGGGIFSGLFEIARVAKDVKNGKQVDVLQQRKAVTDAARSITGISLISVFAALAAKGIISVHDDNDKDERALDQSLGLSGAQFNVDAMLRAFAGEDTTWQDGDWTVSVDFLEPFNAQMYVGYILSQEDTVADMVKAYPEAAVSGVAQSILDMPMMQNLSDTVDLASGALESFAEGDDTAFVDVAGQMLGNYGSSFIPSWVRQTAYMADPYYRDTTGDNAMEKAVNQIKSNIPGLSQTLPKKYSGFGEEQLRHEGGVSGFFNTYINPGKISQISTSDIADSLDRISEASGKKTIYPDYIAPGSFTYTDENGIKQTVTISGKEMTETYQKTYGENVAGLYSDLLSMDYFNSLDAQTQAAIMESAKSYATKLARASVSDYSEIPEYIREKPQNMSVAEAIIRYVAFDNTEKYAGLPISTAAYVDDLLKNLQPEADNGDVRPIQKMETVVADDKLSSYVDDLLRDILPDTTEAKYDKAINKGFTAGQFVGGYRQYLDTAGEGKKQSVIRYCQREMGMSYAAAKKLYEIYDPPKE